MHNLRMHNVTTIHSARLVNQCTGALKSARDLHSRVELTKHAAGGTSAPIGLGLNCSVWLLEPVFFNDGFVRSKGASFNQSVIRCARLRIVTNTNDEIVDNIKTNKRDV